MASYFRDTTLVVKDYMDMPKEGGMKPSAGHDHAAADFRKRFWISLIMTVPILVFSPMLQTLVGVRAVAIVTAYVYSSAVVFGLTGMMFFWELATLIDIMLLGHWIGMKSVMGASRAYTAVPAGFDRFDPTLIAGCTVK